MKHFGLLVIIWILEFGYGSFMRGGLENGDDFGYNEYMKETVCLVSLGCPKNLVDSEVMLGLLSKEGYPLTTEPSKAEILIVNTCSFIRDASQEAIDTVLELSRYKKEGRCQHLIVSGCLPQRYGKVLEKELPEVDLFIGTGSFQKPPPNPRPEIA